MTLRCSLVVVVVGLAALAGCDVNLDLERMTNQGRYDPYEPSEVFDDGKIMRAPPPGTVARETVIGPAELVDGVRGEEYVDELPIDVDRAVLERGRERFEIFCAACHGTLGDGNSQVAENMTLRLPPSLHEPRLRAYPAGRLYRVIRDGYGLMRPYDHELPVADRWAVVAYVQALQLSQGVPLAELPAAMQEEAQPWLK